MLGKSSVLMMLLVGTGSLVGISSIYTPANVETQRGGEPAKQIPGAGQILTDTVLVDRIFPKILAKIDGATLLQKIDGKLLAQKVFPYLDINAVLTQRPGQRVSVDGSDFIKGQAACLPGETAVSAGFNHGLYGSYPYVTRFVREANMPNVWTIISYFDGSGGTLYTYAECLKVELSLKGAQ